MSRKARTNELFFNALPEVFQASQLTVFVLRETKRRQKGLNGSKMQILTACFTCTKYIHVDEVEDFNVRIVTLKTYSKRYPDFNSGKLNYFGYTSTNQYYYSKGECEKRLLSRNTQGYQVYARDSCTKQIYFDWENSSISGLHLTMVTHTKELTDRDALNDPQNILISAGASFDHIKYSFFLGMAEYTSLAGKLNIVDKFTAPFPTIVWTLLLTVVCLLSLLYTYCSVRNFGFFRWLSWTVEISLEQGSIEIVSNVGKTCFFRGFPFVAWVFATNLIRNMYISSLYSNLTRSPTPPDIPADWNELIASSLKQKFAIFIDYLTSKRLVNNTMLRQYENATFDRKVAEFFQRLGRFRVIFLGPNWLHTLGKLPGGYDLVAETIPDRERLFFGDPLGEDNSLTKTEGRFAVVDRKYHHNTGGEFPQNT